MDDGDFTPENVLFTVGHTNLPMERFVELIRNAGIELIVDVRSVPFSRFVPHFNRNTLEGMLIAGGIGYRYLGDMLGGMPEGKSRTTPLAYEDAVLRVSFQEGMRRLSALCKSARCAVMCAEKDPNRCHRRYIIAREVVSRGGAVIHILADGLLLPEGSPGPF